MLAALGGGAVVAGGIALLLVMSGSPAVIPGLITLTLVICALLFHSLNVTVSVEWIIIRFGVGLIRKRFTISDIEDVHIVQNRWYYGWGIKYTPHGWLFNVSGFDAVEICLRHGRKYRIGTDEPKQLHAAIRNAMESDRLKPLSKC